MSTTRLKDEVDPNRFTGKTFTRRKCFPNSVDDYRIMIDGLSAGRIKITQRAYKRVVWEWFFHGPYYPHNYPHHGEEETFEAAGEVLKKLFWRWHAWALKQPGKVTWYGAEE
jgi:hypothetical protein